MSASSLIFLLVVLACPLMMIFMMLGSHGRSSGDAGNAEDVYVQQSTDELRRQRDDLDRQIAAREYDEEARTAGTPRRGPK
jgi:hypothetical protein